jgi:hypothetical protein
VMYILEIYSPLVAASAIASLGLLRYLLAFAFPLFTIRSRYHCVCFDMLRVLMLMMMVDSVRETGCKVGGECFWFLAVAMMPIPWVFTKWGAKIRGWSRFDAVKG